MMEMMPLLLSTRVPKVPLDWLRFPPWPTLAELLCFTFSVSVIYYVALTPLHRF
jgi:hypothetical protein